MAPRTLPGIGLSGFETLGASGWNTFVDANWRIASGWIQARAKSVVAIVPTVGVTDGDTHVLTSAPNINALAVRDNGAWVYLTPQIGCKVYDEATQTTMLFNGTTWIAEIETASNGNGRYTKFPDGTMICHRVTAASSGGAATWTFPFAFVAAPTITGVAVATVSAAFVLDASPSATAATFSVRDTSNARRADAVHLQAVGRWY